MKMTLFRTIVVSMFLCVGSASAKSNANFTDSTSLSCIDPIICQLDSMSHNLFTRDKFFVQNDELLASINLPYDFIPKYSETEIRERMNLIPAVVPLTYNQQVKSFIDLFAYRRRGLMARSLANSQIYFPVFEEILDRKGVPLEFKYLPIVESAFNPIAVSRAGATGLWQLMFGTAQMMGLEINSYIDERRDPIRSTEAAADYLRKLYDMYGDWHLVLAAYNSGPGNVNKAIARAGGVKNFWAIMNYLPAETRSYVPTYIAAVYVMSNYKDFKLVSAEPRRELYSVDTIMVTSKVSLKHISEVIGIAEDELQFLNPSVKTGVIPYTKNGFALNLPISYFALFEARKDEIINDQSLLVANMDAVASIAPKTVIHKVKKNETLAKVAAKYGVSAKSILNWNRLKSSSLWEGQKLKITTTPPAPAVSATYAQAFAPKVIEKPAETLVVAEEDTTMLNAEELIEDTTPKPEVLTAIKLNNDCGCIYHVVQTGDTLWNISQRYEGLTLDKLKADNKTLLNRPIKVGDILKIFL